MLENRGNPIFAPSVVTDVDVARNAFAESKGADARLEAARVAALQSYYLLDLISVASPRGGSGKVSRPVNCAL